VIEMRERKPIVELRDATVLAGGRRKFPRTSWSIRPSEHWAIVGPNGSGKTWLARALWGGAHVIEGAVLWPADGVDAPDGPGPPGFHPGRAVAHVSFEDQAELVARSTGYLQGRYESIGAEGAPTAADWLGSAVRGGEARRLLRRLGIADILGRRLPHLSNGEMRKLLVARALLAGPRLLVLEEPLAGLDRKSRRELRGVLAEAARLGVTLVIVTSRARDAAPPIRNVLLVRGGRIAARGSRRLLAGGSPGPTAARPARPRPLTRHRREPGEVLVELRGATVEYGGFRALDRLSWRVREGEHWAVVGPNGSGKTTLLSLVLADHPQAYANDVSVLGRRRGDGASIWDVKAAIGHFSPELGFHYPRSWTVLDCIASGFFDSAGLYRTPSSAQERKARAAGRRVGLGKRLDRTLGSVSDGERRLALIARAIVKEPRLLILDEPCLGLDEAHRRKVLRLVERLGRRGGPTIIFVTHEPGEVPGCVTRTLRLERGRAKGRH
jgi:molybdate transport system ATP-binding protein